MNKILLYSDGVFFGGSEYVMVHILKNKHLNDKYEFKFAYRKHKDYQEHIESLFTKEERTNFYPLKLWSFDNTYGQIEKIFKNVFLQRILKGVISILVRLQVCNIYNYIYLKRFLKTVDANLIHVNNGGYPGAESCLVMAKAAKELGWNVIMQINNMPNPSKKYWDSIVKRSVDTFIIASKYTSEKIVTARDITNGNIYTLRDNVKYVPPAKHPDELKKELGLRPDAIVLIQVALLLLYKGQIHILEALNLIREKNKAFFDKVVLILIGSGEIEEFLKKYIEENDLTEHVKMLGYRNDYIDYVNMADVLVHPSRANEDMPLIVLSAMSLGKPIISCDFAGIPEEVEHMKSGILLNPNSETFVRDLSEAIPVAFENRSDFGKRGEEIFEEEFSEAKYEKGLSALYDKYL